jgi:hypothetical protein
MATIAAPGMAPIAPPRRADACYFHPAPGNGNPLLRLSLDMDASFKLLLDYARNNNQRLTDVARRLVESATADFAPPARRSPRA